MKVYSKGRVPVYTDYKENIIVEQEHIILAWKANKDRLRHDWFSEDLQKKYPDGFSKLSSLHSEDALTWNLFRTLQLNNRISYFTDLFDPGIQIDKIWFWGHDSNRQSEEIDPEIQDILNKMEPWGKDGVKQQTEPDVVLMGDGKVYMVECKLGKQSEKVKAWSRSTEGMRPDYAAFIDEHRFKLFANSFNYERDGNRFYQLFRNYLLGAALGSKWHAKFSLLAIVNEQNSNLKGRSHQEEFNYFRSILEDSSNTFLITWQQIWDALPKEENLLPLHNYMENHALLGLTSMKHMV